MPSSRLVASIDRSKVSGESRRLFAPISLMMTAAYPARSAADPGNPGRNAVPGQIIHVDARAGQGRAQWAGSLDIRTRAEGVDAFDMDAVGDPAFAAKQYAHDLF